MFFIDSRKIEFYFALLHMYTVYGHLPIAALIVFDNNSYAITYNTINEHAENILLQFYSYRKINAIFITLEPCISCAFNIIMQHINYVFFSNYNIQYGGFSYIKYIHKCKVFGGLYTNNTLKNFFINQR